MISLIFENFVRIFFRDVELRMVEVRMVFEKKFERFIWSRCLATIKILQWKLYILRMINELKILKFEKKAIKEKRGYPKVVARDAGGTNGF